jgi:hypothetical protein
LVVRGKTSLRINEQQDRHHLVMAIKTNPLETSTHTYICRDAQGFKKSSTGGVVVVFLILTNANPIHLMPMQFIHSLTNP